MKKILSVFIAGLLIISLIGCDKTISTTSNIDTETTTLTTSYIEDTSTTEVVTTVQTTESSNEVELTQSIVDQYSSETVTLAFTYYLGTKQSEHLETMITNFETLFPNVDIVSTRMDADRVVTGDFERDTLGGVASELVLVEQKYLASISYSLEPLTKYMNSQASINGLTVGVSINDLELDMFTNFYGYSDYVSYPFRRLSQVIFANRDILAQNSTLLTNSGIQTSTNGFLSHQNSLSLDDLLTMTNVINDKYILTVELPEYTLEMMLGQIDESIFEDGAYKLDKVNIKNLMTRLRELSSEKAITLASYFDQSYTSTPFSELNTILAVSSSDSLRYMTDYTTFNLDVLPMFHVSNTKGMFYGSDFGVNKFSTDAEKFYSWLFIRYATDMAYDYMDLCLDFGYAPIYKENIYETNQKYIDFLAIGNEFVNADGTPNWNQEDPKWDSLYLSLIQQAYQVNRTNITERVFLPRLSENYIGTEFTYIIDYLDDIFLTTENIDTLTSQLDEDLS